MEKGRELVGAAVLPSEHGFEVLAPLRRHDDIADVQGGIDAAGDPHDDEVGDLVMVEREFASPWSR